VATFTGDLMLACFGYPQAREGDAEQAVSAGLELLNAIGRLGGRCGRLRLGIATGPTVVGDLIGRDDPKHLGVFGETRKLASALRQIADPSTVVIAARTRRLIGRLFDCRERKVDLEGDDNSAWEVLGPSSVESRFEALHGSPLTPMVGREEEVQVLLRHWRDAKSGEMRVVLVTGEPGIGKSRLAVALQDRLGAEQYICFRFFSSPHRQDNAFYPIIRQLEAAAGFELNDTAENEAGEAESPARPGRAFRARVAASRRVGRTAATKRARADQGVAASQTRNDV
jgi:AAA ATPase domain/Adenylate and Guanylate cyclase catalytic domain